MNAMADRNMTETDIHEMELRMEREQQELAARHAAERAKIEEALKASAGEAFGRILATMEKFKDHFSAVQKRKISGFFGEEQATSPKPARAPRKASKSARVPRYMLPDGDTWTGQGPSVPPNWVAWLKSAEGKEWSKKFLATDEGKAWRQANLVDGKIKTDRNGNPRGPFPINPAYQG